MDRGGDALGPPAVRRLSDDPLPIGKRGVPEGRRTGFEVDEHKADEINSGRVFEPGSANGIARPSA